MNSLRLLPEDLISIYANAACMIPAYVMDGAEAALNDPTEMSLAEYLEVAE